MEKFKSFVICKQPGRYIGWPTVAKTRDGELLAVFSGDRDEHVCPHGKTFLVRSRDRGNSWSAPELVNNTPLDDRDAGIIALPSGTLVISWFTSLAYETPSSRQWIARRSGQQMVDNWQRATEKITDADRKAWLGHWIRRSEDGGKTWQPPVRQTVSSPHGPILLNDGRLLYIGSASVESQSDVLLEDSRDEGRTWSVIGAIPQTPEIRTLRLNEPHVVEAGDGKLIAMFRCEHEDFSKRHLWQSESSDGGRTWNVPYPTPIWGFPPHLIKLSDGRLLVSYGHRRARFSERACLSRDNGKTWDTDHIITLNSALNDDLGYPSSVELGNGEILTVYYQIDQPGEKTCLMGTFWSLVK